jgi:hypothetical protein
MKAKLHKAKSLTIVTGIHTCPNPEKDKENAKLYVKLNEDAYAKIVQYLHMSVLPKPRPKNSMGTSYGNFTNKNTPVTI